MLTNIKKEYSLVNPVYIGDTAGDQEAATLANVEFIHAAYGFGKIDGKTKSFNSFPAIVEYFMDKA